MSRLTPSHTPTPRSAAFFDLGHTILARSSVLAYRQSFLDAGLFTWSDAVKTASAALRLQLLPRTPDRIDSTRDLLASLVAGWPVDAVATLTRNAYPTCIEPWIYPEARALIAHHLAVGRDVIIVSASPDFTVTPVAHALGVTHTLATRLTTRHGLYTGDVDFFCKGPTKVDAISRLAATCHYNLDASYAYSDSISDAPLLESVGHATAINPDRALRRLATARNWPIHTYPTPTPTPRP